MAIYDYQGNPISSGGGSQFVSVSDFGATGDGTTDDATAIQSALDSLSTSGGIIYFPVGTYKVCTMLHYNSKQTLWFENGATLRAGASGMGCIIGAKVDTTITGYNGVHDVLIHGGTFDGSSFSSNILLFGTVHSQNIEFDGCSFVGAFGLAHNLEINSSKNVRIHNCVFTRGTNVGQDAEMIQIDRASYGAYVEPINEDNTNCSYIDIYDCTFGPNAASPGVGNHSGTPDIVNVHDNFFIDFTGNRGAIDLASTNLSIYNNVFSGCTIGVGSSGATHYIHDNRFIGVTTATAGETSVVHNNLVNGTFIA